jgi:hypothetical protein
VGGDVSLDGREGLRLRRHCEVVVVGSELGCSVFCVRCLVFVTCWFIAALVGLFLVLTSLYS